MIDTGSQQGISFIARAVVLSEGPGVPIEDSNCPSLGKDEPEPN